MPDKIPSQSNAPASAAGTRAVAVVTVRGGVASPGSDEIVAEAAGSTLLVGDRVDLAADALGPVLADTAGPVLLVEAPDAGIGSWAAALAPVLADARFVLLAASPDGRDLAPRLAAELDRPLLANALRVTGELVSIVTHGGRRRELVDPGGPFVATLLPGVRGVASAQVGSAADPSAQRRPEVVVLAPGPPGPPDPADAVTVEVCPPDPATMDLSEATRIVGAGAGLMGAGDPAELAQRFALLDEVGAAIGASLGATRVVTDAGYVDHVRQIGTTGVVVDPDLYLAWGVSGAVQHTAGLGHPDHVIAVNTDPHCPMMAAADLAVVGDAVGILEALAERLGVRPATQDAGDAHQGPGAPAGG